MEELNDVELDPNNPLIQAFQKLQEVLRMQYEKCCSKRQELNNPLLKISSVSS